MSVMRSLLIKWKEFRAWKPSSPWAKWTLIILRKLAFPLLCFLVLSIGLYVGYGGLGGQEHGFDIFKWSTWKHMFDLVFAD